MHGRHGSGHADLAAPEPHEAARVLRHLASFAPADGSNAIGPHGVFADAFGLLVTNGGPTAPMRGDPPEVVLRDPTLVREERVLALWPGRCYARAGSHHARVVADLWRFERDNNPDATVGNPLIDSNPVDVLSDHGSYIVADACTATHSCASHGRGGSLF